MFGGYKFGDISKGVYNKATGTKSTESTDSIKQSTGYQFGDISKGIYNKVTTNNQQEKTKENKGYQFGDITKSAYNNVSNYKFGDLTKSTFHSITSQFNYKPFKVNINKLNVIKEGFLDKRSEILLTYRKYWALLVSQDDINAIYLFERAKQYESCIEIIDLSLYSKVQSMRSYASFDIISSNNKRQRFVAQSYDKKIEWINCLFLQIGMQKLKEMKQCLENMEINDENDNINFNLQCIAYYIIDLEYKHKESGNPHNLLRNQNFIISAIIWGYIHEENKVFDGSLHKEKCGKVEEWQKPMAVAHGIHGGVQGGVIGGAHGGVKGGVIGMIGGVFAVTGFATSTSKGQKAAVVAIIPIGLIAGAVCGGTYGVVQGVSEGFKDSYKSVQ